MKVIRTIYNFDAGPPIYHGRDSEWPVMANCQLMHWLVQLEVTGVCIARPLSLSEEGSIGLGIEVTRFDEADPERFVLRLKAGDTIYSRPRGNRRNRGCLTEEQRLHIALYLENLQGPFVARYFPELQDPEFLRGHPQLAEFQGNPRLILDTTKQTGGRICMLGNFLAEYAPVVARRLNYYRNDRGEI